MKDKELRDPVNFKRAISYFVIAFYFYLTFMVFLTSFIDPSLVAYSLILAILPLPIFILIIIFLLYKDDQIASDNNDIQKEIERVRESTKIRKKAEEELD